MLSFDTAGSGSIEEQGERDGVHRNYGSHALYDVGKILVAGGGRPAVSSANTIDINGTSPVVQDTGSMEFEHRRHRLTVLADGSVLATGGLSGSSEQVDLAAGVFRLSSGPGHRRLEHDGVDGGHAAVSLDRAAAPRRAGAVGGRRCLRALQGGGIRSEQRPIFSPPYLLTASGEPAPRPKVSSRRRRSARATAARLRCGCRTPTVGEEALMRLGAVSPG